MNKVLDAYSILSITSLLQHLVNQETFRNVSITVGPTLQQSDRLTHPKPADLMSFSLCNFYPSLIACELKSHKYQKMDNLYEMLRALIPAYNSFLTTLSKILLNLR